MTVIAFSKAVGPIPLSCVLSERHRADIEITANPIETGAEVNDHAYIKPKEVILEVGDENAALTYNALIRFQETRIPFTLVTGLTVYRNMLIQTVDATRDKTYSRVLYAAVVCREIIIVSSASAAAGLSPGGQPGGLNSLKSANPNSALASNSLTSDRVASVVQTGDNPITTPSRPQSILSGVFQ